MSLDQAAAPPRSRLKILSLILVLFAACFTACSDNTANQNGGNQSAAPAARKAPSGPNSTAVIETELGNIKIELLKDQAPATADNFEELARSGFYNGLVFHRTVRGFMIQGGDPNGNGTGGRTAKGAPLPNEVDRRSSLYQGGYSRGLVAMANRGTPETATSQFFIMHQNYPLPPNYTIFGRVSEGIEVVDKIATAPVAGERPVNPVVMKRVYIQ